MSLNFGYHVNFIFLYQTLLVLSQIKDRKHIEQNFHSVAGFMRHRWDFGGAGGSKTLAWGFAMVPHRLCLLVLLIIIQYWILYDCDLSILYHMTSRLGVI